MAGRQTAGCPRSFGRAITRAWVAARKHQSVSAAFPNCQETVKDSDTTAAMQGSTEQIPEHAQRPAEGTPAAANSPRLMTQVPVRLV